MDPLSPRSSTRSARRPVDLQAPRGRGGAREEAPKEHKIPRDIDAEIVILLALTRQRDVLHKYLREEEGTREASEGLDREASEGPDRAVCVACLEGATDALCLLRPASRDLRRALHFLRRRRTTRTTH